MSAVRAAALSLALALVLAVGLALPRGASRAETSAAKMRGMVVSCPIYGQVWGSEDFSEALRTLKGLGVRWVQIHPYARIERSGRVRFTPPEATGYLAGAVARARREGVPLFWKPHLAYWGSFAWRGAIDFGDDEAAWDRFFETYRAFILAQARFAAESGIPLFSVGTELDATTRFSGRWRRLIREVRAVYPGELTYAANWDRVMSTPFWDALDYVGAQGYHPLELGGSPSASAAWAAWAGARSAMEDLHRRTGKRILFTEIGYPDAAHAARTPWKPRGLLDRAAPSLRRSLVRVALERVEALPYVAGMFWWKWIPGRTRGDFAMQPEDMRALLSDAWGPSTASKRDVDAAGAGP